MSDALMSAFFERDLTDAEDDALSAMIQQSTESAERFANLAAVFYADLGLPEPRWPGEDPPKGFGGLAAAGSIGMILGGALTWRIARGPATVESVAPFALPVPPAETASPPPPATRPIASHHAHPAPTRPPAIPAASAISADQGAPVSVSSTPATGTSRGNVLIIKVRLTEPGPLAVDLLDENGKLIRHLIDARLEAGDHRIPFDRKDGDGRRLRPGRYEVVVWSDGRRSSQPLLIQEPRNIRNQE